MDKPKTGYTMIELLVVITIILILGAMGFIAYAYASGNGRDSRRKSDIEQLRSAMEFYRTDAGYYPGDVTSFTAISSALSVLVTDGYMSALPPDPKDNTAAPYMVIFTDGRGTPVHYYGYCLAAKLETPTSTSSNCSSGLPAGYNYGVKNP